MRIEDATRAVADKVGMSFCPGKWGFDEEVVRLAHDAGHKRDDICRNPNLVAQSITAMLDDMVKNP